MGYRFMPCRFSVHGAVMWGGALIIRIGLWGFLVIIIVY